MDRDRYFVERCKNLPRKQRQTILLLEYRVQIFYLKAEDNPHPSNRVRVVNLTVQILYSVSNFITETGFLIQDIRNQETTRVYNSMRSGNQCGRIYATRKQPGSITDSRSTIATALIYATRKQPGSITIEHEYNIPIRVYATWK